MPKTLATFQQVSLCFLYTHWYFDRSSAVQDVHHYLKYGNRPQMGIHIGKQIGYGIQQSFAGSTLPDTIAPIPLHKGRFLERGYNQSAQLAKGISDVLEVPLTNNLLSRHQATRSQTGLTKQERIHNVEGVFSIRESKAQKELHVLLVDDVLTTGATLLSAAKCLKDAGIKKISIAAMGLARS